MAKIDFIEILYESFESFEYNPDLWKSRGLQKTNLFHDFETSHAFFFFFFLRKNEREVQLRYHNFSKSGTKFKYIK